MSNTGISTLSTLSTLFHTFSAGKPKNHIELVEVKVSKSPDKVDRPDSVNLCICGQQFKTLEDLKNHRSICWQTWSTSKVRYV